MKIEQILYGMQTSDGKILKLKTPGVDALLTLKSQETIRQLKPVDSKKYLWFRTEQTFVFPFIIEVADKDPKHGGRTWVQNQTFLMGIHDFFSLVQQGQNPFAIIESNYLGELEKFPESFNSLNI